MSITNHYRSPANQGNSVVANVAVGVTPTLRLKGGASYSVAVISTSSLAFKMQGKIGPNDWIDIAAGVTPSANTVEWGNCIGFSEVRVVPTAGTGLIVFTLSAQVLGGAGGSSSGGGDATASNQTTMITALQLLDDAIQTDDGTGFTPATSKVSMIGGLADEASTDSVDEGDAGAVRMTLDRQLRVHPSGAAVQTGLSIASGSNQTVILNGAAGVAVEVTAVDTSHSITVTGILASGGTARNIECIQVTGGYGRFRRGGVAIALTAGDRLYIIGDYYSVTLTHSANTSSTVTTRTMTQSAAMKILTAPVELKPISNQNIANGTLDDAGGTALTVPTGATGAWITLIETTLGTPAVVYMTTDGGTPSATDGATIRCSNLPFEMTGSDLLAAVKFLAPDTGSRLSAEYFEHVIRCG